MKETTEILHNMSGASRSTAYVEPRRVEPPPIVAHGARVRSNTGVLVTPIGIPFVKDEFGNHIFRETARASYKKSLYEAVTGQRYDQENSFDEDLRRIANEVVMQYGLIGCVIVQPYIKLKVIDNVLSCPRLSIAILTKSSNRLFVASKTPNLSDQVWLRILITYDPRISAIQEKLNENRTT